MLKHFNVARSNTGQAMDLVAAVGFALGLAIWLVSAGQLTRPFAGDEVDDGQYLVGAQSLSAGSGYRLISRVGNPVATKYPPGVSAITSLALTITPGKSSTVRDRRIAHLLMLASAVGMAVACRRLFILMQFAAPIASVLSLAILFHPDVVAFSEYLGADLPFAAVATWLACRWAVRWQIRRAVPWYVWVVDGLLIAAATLLRGNGLSLLLAGLVGCLICARDKPVRNAILLGGTAVLLLGLVFYLVGHQTGNRDTGNYRTELLSAYSIRRHVWQIPIENLMRMPRTLTSAIWSMSQWTKPVSNLLQNSPILTFCLNAGILIVVLRGFVALSWKTLGPAVIAQIVLTVLIFCVWHYPFEMRFGVSLLPFAIGSFVVGVGLILDRLAKVRTVQLATAFALLFGALLPTTSVFLHARKNGGVTGGRIHPDQVEAFEMIRQRTPIDAVVIAANPELVYLNTGRQGVPMNADALIAAHLPPTAKSFEQWLRSAGGRPLFLYGWRPVRDRETDSMRGAMKAIPGGFQEIYSTPDGSQWLGRRIEPQSNGPIPATAF